MIQMFHTLNLMKQRVARLPGEAEGEYRTQGEIEVLLAADRVVAATEAERSQLQWLYQADTARTTIIPPGVDLSHFYPIPRDEAKEVIGVPPCENLLLFVGRIEPLKGIDTLIQAIAHMQAEKVKVCLTVIGGDAETGDNEPNAELERLKSICQEVGLGDLVTFVGQKGQDTLPYYYSAAEVVVVPSFYESFGMVALEAMACGTPVVASQVGGLAFLIQDGVTGFTVPVDDPQAMAERLIKLYKDPELSKQIGLQAASFAQGYGWEVIADRIIELYREVLKGEPLRSSQDRLIPRRPWLR